MIKGCESYSDDEDEELSLSGGPNSAVGTPLSGRARPDCSSLCRAESVLDVDNFESVVEPDKRTSMMSP